MEISKQHLPAALPGCYPPLAKAVGAFYQKWGPYSSKSRSTSIFSLLSELIDSPLAEYISGANSRFRPRTRHARFSLVRYWRIHGYIHLVNRIRKAHKLIEAANYPPCQLDDLFAQATAHVNLLDDSSAIAGGTSDERWSPESEALQTLATIRSLIENSAAKVPKEQLIRGVTFRRTKIYERCAFCDKPTEVQAFKQNKDSRFDWENEIHSVPSSKYCTEHRRNKPSDKTPEVSNANYKRQIRNRSKYLAELHNLETASCRSSVMVVGGELVAIFLNHLVDDLDLGICDSDRLWNAARNLVDEKVSNQKKRIVMLIASGCSELR